jgi:hypothetical protein
MTFKVGWNVDCIVVVVVEHLLMCTATSQLMNWTELSRLAGQLAELKAKVKVT